MNDSYGKCLVAVAAAGVVPLIYVARQWAQGGQFEKDYVRIDGKVVIITGANTGIGKETALDLAKRGGRIYLACRDTKKAEAVTSEIIAETGNKNVFTRELDLASFTSIRKFVDDFKKEENQLSILINNAGVMAIPRWTTVDGLEMQIGTNHFGHFLLTNLLLDTLKATSPSRIVNVSSEAHRFGKIDRDDINLEKSYGKWSSYGQSKLANILFTRELAKRLDGTGVTTNSLHPGSVKTDLQRHITILNLVFSPLSFLFKTPKAGAQTSVALAVDPDLEKVTGKYFADCKVKTESKAAQCDDTAKWLWAKSEEITELSGKNSGK